MDFSEVKEMQSKYYINTLTKLNICVVSGRGSTITDSQGKEYIDFLSGNGENILGHNHAALLSAIVAQSHKMINSSNVFFNEPQALLGSLLIDGTIFDKVMLCNSGNEAITTAFRMVRKHWSNKKQKKGTILVVSDSLRGISYGSSYEYQSASPIRNIKFTPHDDYEKFKENLTEDVGAVMLETVQPENGLALTKYEFLLNAYARCKSKDVLLIMNEFFTGVGRTGQMFSFEQTGIQPDLVMISRGLGGGIPVSALLARGEIAYTLSSVDQDIVYASYPLACAAAGVVLKELKNGLLEHVALQGEYLKAKFAKFSKHNFIKDIRGLGLIAGIQLCDKVKAHDIVLKMAKEGVLIGMAHNNTLLFIPPYIITQQEIDLAADKLTKIFADTNV